MKKHTYLEDGKTKAETLLLGTSDDVVITDPEPGHTLIWDGNDWTNQLSTITENIDGGSFI